MRPLLAMLSTLAVATALLLGGEGQTPATTLPAAAGETPAGDPAERLMTRLMADGKYEACLALIEQEHKALLADANLRLSVWEIDFKKSEVDHALVGGSHLYFTYHTPNSDANAPGMKPTGPLIEPSARSDWRHVVVCADARTGRILWSRPYGGLSRLAVNTATDMLYLIGVDAVIELSPDTGESTAFPLPKKEHVIGIWTKSGMTVSAPHGLRDEWHNDAAYLYRPETRSLVAVNLRQQATLSPDESKRLALTTDNYHGFNNNIICQTAGGTHLWSFQVEGLRSPAAPRFYKGDVLWMPGSARQKGQVVRLAGDTGNVLWRTVLPNGAYKSSDNQLGGGNYAWDDWDTLRPWADGNELLAVDGTGRLIFLNAETGAILRTARPMATHLCAPTEVGDLVVFCGHNGARAVPRAIVMEPAGRRADERGLLVRKARCLAALGRLDEAMAAVDYVTARDEDFADAWRARAEVCGLRGDALDQSFCLCRYAQLAGQADLPELRDLCGLLRMMPLGSRPAWQMVDVGGKEIYLGTQRGDLWVVWPETLETRVVQNREMEIAGLSGDVRLSFHALTGPRATDAEVRVTSAEPNDAPAAWYIHRGDDGRTIFFHGKYYRPLRGGKVCIWDGKEMVERTSNLEAMGEWQIHVSPSGPLGYGIGGVYALDGDLCPVRLLIGPRTPDKKAERIRVACLRSIGDSLGMVVQAGTGAYLQVYGAADGKMRSEVPLGRWLSAAGHSSQILVLGDGYLFSDRQLTWVGGQEGAAVWQFGPPASRTEARASERGRHFGDPVVRDGKLLVAGLDGWLYAFDTARIIGSRPKASAPGAAAPHAAEPRLAATAPAAREPNESHHPTTVAWADRETAEAIRAGTLQLVVQEPSRSVRAMDGVRFQMKFVNTGAMAVSVPVNCVNMMEVEVASEADPGHVMTWTRDDKTPSADHVAYGPGQDVGWQSPPVWFTRQRLVGRPAEWPYLLPGSYRWRLVVPGEPRLASPWQKIEVTQAGLAELDKAAAELRRPGSTVIRVQPRRTKHNPSDARPTYTRLDDALAMAKPGDVVLVGPGSHETPDLIVPDDVWVVGAGPADTIITVAAQYNQKANPRRMGLCGNCRLVGMTILGAAEGTHCSLVKAEGNDCRPTLTQCILIPGESDFSTVLCWGGASATLRNSIVVSPVGDYGVFVRERSRASLEYCTIFSRGFGVGMMDSSPVTMKRCIIVGRCPGIISDDSEFGISESLLWCPGDQGATYHDPIIRWRMSPKAEDGAAKTVQIPMSEIFQRKDMRSFDPKLTAGRASLAQFLYPPPRSEQAAYGAYAGPCGIRTVAQCEVPQPKLPDLGPMVGPSPQ